MNTKKIIGIVTVAIATTLLTCEQVPDYCSNHNPYEPDSQFCFGGKAYNKCGGRDFNPNTHDCIPGLNEVGTLCATGAPVRDGTLCGPHTLSIAVAPSNGGEVINPTGKNEFDADEEVSLVAVAYEDFEFTGWAGVESESADINLTMRRNTSVIAMFRPMVNALVVETFSTEGASGENSGGRVVFETEQKDIYEINDTVTITAIASDGFEFENWAGASSSTEPTITITMSEGQTLIAIFRPVVYTLTVNANPRDGGAVFVNGNSYVGIVTENFGSNVVISARANDGFVFTGWSGGTTGTVNIATIDLTSGDVNIIANFERVDWGDRSLPPHLNHNIRYGSFVDSRDGQRYFTVVMPDGKEWMAENLNYRNPAWAYNDVTAGAITISDKGSWCYGNHAPNCDLYGRMYNFYAAREACPSGWRLTTSGDWYLLIDEIGGVGGSLLAVEKLKSTAHWYDEGHGTNDYGFSALPGGERRQIGETGWGNYSGLGTIGYWWVNEIATAIIIQSDNAFFTHGIGALGGASVRCIRDNISYGSLTDVRDGKTYRTVQMPDGKTWMADNLDFEVLDGEGSWCYKDSSDNCALYGRLYDWATAMNIDSSYNNSLWGGSNINHRGICPAGWHLPNDSEWATLINSVGETSTVGTKLKSSDYWFRISEVPIGRNTYGFSALPGGLYRSPISQGVAFVNSEYQGLWWTASELNESIAWQRNMWYEHEEVRRNSAGKTNGYSVRCVRTD